MTDELELEEIAKQIAARKNAESNQQHSPQVSAITETSRPPQQDLGNVFRDNLAVNPEVAKAERIERLNERLNTDITDMRLDIGYKNIPVINLPSKGMYYPLDWYITIRPSTVAEIRHFSSIDEYDLIDIDEKFNYILEKCVRIKSSKGIMSYKYIKEVDKFYILFAIRELTFAQGENRLTSEISCECGKKRKVEIRKEYFDIFNIDENFKKYINEQELCFSIETKSSGNFNMYIPSIGVTMFIKSYLKNKISRQEQYDKSFVRLAPYLFDDWKTLNESTYNQKLQETNSWSIMKISTVTNLVEMLEKSSRNSMKVMCECGVHEVTSPIRFHGGVKSLFLISDIFDELI